MGRIVKFGLQNYARRGCTLRRSVVLALVRFHLDPSNFGSPISAFFPDINNLNVNFEDNAIELRRMAVSSKHRRQGIAGRLIKVALAHAQAHDRRYIDLTTTSYQKGALDLYEKYGWVIRQRWVLFNNIYTHKLRRYLSDKI